MTDWLSGVSLTWGKVIAVSFFIGMTIWAWFRPRSYIFHEAPDSSRWRDLRIWATVFLGIQIALYIIF